MSDLNETLAQEAAELINGGEWRDGKWYSDGHRDAWRRALKPAADRIEKLEMAARGVPMRDMAALSKALDRIETLEAALRACHASLNIAFEYDESSRVFGKKFNDAVDADILARKALEGKDE